MTTRLLAFAGIAALAVASLFVGVGELSPMALLSDPDARELLLVSRLPRTAAAVLTGASLAVSGLILQLLTRNRFVEPNTAGPGQSAALGVLAATMLTPTASLPLKMALASVAALIGTAGFLLIVRRLPPSQPLLPPLVGVVYGGVIGAAVIFVAYEADLLQYLEVWLNGEFSGVLRGRYELLWITGGFTLLAYVIADQLTIVGLGRDTAVNLGLNFRQIYGLGLFIVAVTTALTVVTVGAIPFVGLIAPNLVSRLMGDNLRAALPWTAGFGAALVLASDLIGRLVRYPYEIPVGTVFGVIGSLAFLWLLHARPARAR